MSVKTQLPFSLTTSSALGPDRSAAEAGVVRRVVATLQAGLARVVTGSTVRRGLHNQDAWLENQRLLRKDPDARLRASMLAAAYAEVEPAEAKHLELVYLAEGADLFSEGHPWAIHYAPRSLVLMNRSTRIAVGPVASALVARLDQLGQSQPV